MKQRERAFTLIELMVVIIIIGILLGILFTGWNYINEQQASKKAKLEVVGLKNAVDEYLADYGEYPNCPKGICTPGETLFMSLAGFHNENGSLELPPYTSKIPTHLFIMTFRHMMKRKFRIFRMVVELPCSYGLRKH